MYAVAVKPMRLLINSSLELIHHLVCSCPISSCLSKNITISIYRFYLSFFREGQNEKSDRICCVRYKFTSQNHVNKPPLLVLTSLLYFYITSISKQYF